VPIEEYVPKVIIEGKWGTGPGEFGYDGFNPEDFSPNSAVFGPDDLIHPRSLSVDSKGNIYILDVANNRIQKFNKNGKHLTDLKVDSWSGYELDPEKGWWYKVRGINIVIDSKDNLYYYLKRTKDGKETGEVWQFRNDKMVKKGPQSKSKPQTAAVVPFIDPKKDAEIKEEAAGRNFYAKDTGNRELRFGLDSGEELYGKRRVLFDEDANMWLVRIRKADKIWDKKYSPSGNLMGITQFPPLSEFLNAKGEYLYDVALTDAARNHYLIGYGKSGISVVKIELIRTLK
jgi:hypothetical protein